MTVTVAARECTTGTPCSIFPGAAPTTVRNGTDNSPLELGVKFRSTDTGRITGIRFYKAGSESGSYTGRLYTASGSLLGSSQPTTLSTPGWQVLPLTTSVSITAGTTYVASYYSDSGWFSITDPGSPGSLATAAVNPPLRGLAAGEDGPNGVFHYGAGGGFPDTAPASPAPTTGPTCSSSARPTRRRRPFSPPSRRTASLRGVAHGAGHRDVRRAGRSRQRHRGHVHAGPQRRRHPGGGLRHRRRRHGDPGTDRAPARRHHVRRHARRRPSGISDTSDDRLAADHTWSFTTATSAEVTLFGDTTPGTTTDANDYELGVRFSSATDGLVTGIRFYKGAQNTGLHTGRLWDATTQQSSGP